MKRPRYEFAVRRSAFRVRCLLVLPSDVERWTRSASAQGSPLSVRRFFSVFGVRCWAFGVRCLLTLPLSVGRWAHSACAQGRLLGVGRLLPPPLVVRR